MGSIAHLTGLFTEIMGVDGIAIMIATAGMADGMRGLDTAIQGTHIIPIHL